MDRTKMTAGIRLFLDGLGEAGSSEETAATPERVARAWAEDLVSGYAQDPVAELTWTAVDEGGALVLVRGISLSSVCVHHLLPFSGVAHVAYLPGRRLAGLSKIGRVVDTLARRLQTQERLTASIVRAMHEALDPRGVVAVLQAGHTCMTLRGVRKERSEMITVASAGLLESDAAARREVLDLLAIGAGGGGRAG
jgi:GTP cyclohydrolase I